MLTYIIATSISTLCAWKSANPIVGNKVKLGKGIRILLGVVSFLLLFLVAAVRYNVGTDFNAYLLQYEYPHWFNRTNIVIKTIMDILRLFTSNAQIFFIFSSLFIYGCFYCCVFKESASPAYSIFMFVAMEDYFVSMNIVRQYMAIALVWLGISYLVNKKYWKYLLFVLAGAAIHSAVLLAILLIPLSIWSPRPRRLCVIAAIASGFLFVGYPLVVSLITRYTVYGRYFSSSYAGRQYSVAFPMLLIYVVMLVVVMLLCNREKMMTDNKMKIFFYCVVLNVVIMVASFRMTANTYRLTYTFTSLMAIYFPTMIESINGKKNQKIVAAIAAVLFTIWTVMLITSNNQNVLPYTTIFQNKTG